MTPAEHLAEAEQLVTEVPDPATGMMIVAPPLAVYLALAHVGIALAAELGVPHADAATGGVPGAAPAAAG
jgi:hypothetical protein